MKKILAAVVALILLISGCATDEIKLDNRFRPLKAVKENPVQPRGVVTTIFPYLLVRDLDDWQKSFPEGSHHREALLRHERFHAWRQKKLGLSEYLYKYVFDRKFRLEEEKLANYIGLTYLKSRGVRVDVEGKARFLSGKAYKKMVSYEEIKKWILDVMAGRWKPPIEIPKELM